MVHMNCRNLMIFVSCIIINSLITVTAGGIKSDLIFSWFYLTAASLLVNRPQDMKELADAFFLGISGKRMVFHKR